MDSHAARLRIAFDRTPTGAMKKLADYIINYIKELVVNVTSNISAINDTVLSIDNASKSILK